MTPPPDTLREAMGLASSHEWQESVDSGALGPVDRRLGVGLTTAESQQAQTQIARQRELAANVSNLNAFLGDQFAGAWIDHAAGGTVHVSVTGDAAGASERLNSFYKSTTGATVVADPVERSVRDLESLRVAATSIQGGSRFKITGIGIDVKRNAVEVDVDGDVNEAAATAGRIAPGFVVREATAPTTSNSSRTDPGNPPTWQAGLRIDGSQSCTGAFRVYHQGATNVLTAGHCGYSAFYVGGTYLGSTAYSSWTPGATNIADAARIPVSGWAQPDCVYLAPNNCAPVSGFGDPIQGGIVCSSTATSNAFGCGIVELFQFDAPSAGGSILRDAARFYHFADPPEGKCTVLGDSGSPIIEWPNNIYGVGIASAFQYIPFYGDDCVNGARRAVFTKWFWVAYALGVQGPGSGLSPTTGYTGAVQYGVSQSWVFVNRDGRITSENHSVLPNPPTSLASFSPWSAIAAPAYLQLWTGNPAAGRNLDGRVEMFGVATNGNLYHLWQTSTGCGDACWSAPDNLSNPGSTLYGSVAVAPNQDGRLSVFVISQDGLVHYRTQVAPNSGWGAWDTANINLNNPLLGGGLAAARNPSGNKIDIVGTDNAGGAWLVRQQAANGNSWGSWTRLTTGGFKPGTTAGMTYNHDGRLEYWAAAPDGNLAHLWQTSPGGTWNTAAFTTTGRQTAGGTSAVTLWDSNWQFHQYVYSMNAYNQMVKFTYELGINGQGDWRPWCEFGQTFDFRYNPPPYVCF